MRTRQSFSLLTVCVVSAVLTLLAQGAFAQYTSRPGPRATPSYGDARPTYLTRPAWTRPGLWGAWHSPATTPLAPLRLPEATEPTEETEKPEKTSTTEGQTIINNTNVVNVRPPYYGYHRYYGGLPYYRPPYRQPTKYVFFDRGLYNGMPGPFGLSGFRPLRTTTIP
jgi:hypothetical protein